MSLVRCYLFGAMFGVSIFFSITYTFKFCARAGLNIGIAETIWGFTPFFGSILDYFFNGVKLEFYSIIGIACMFSAAAFISLSHLFEEASIHADPINPLPIYIPVMTSACMPVCCSCFGLYIKYVLTTKKISSHDFTFSYFFIYKGVCLLLSILYFRY